MRTSDPTCDALGFVKVWFFSLSQDWATIGFLLRPYQSHNSCEALGFLMDMLKLNAQGHSTIERTILQFKYKEKRTHDQTKMF